MYNHPHVDWQPVKEEPPAVKEETISNGQLPKLEGTATVDTSNFYIRLLWGHRKKLRKSTFEPLMEFQDLVNMVVSAFPGVKKEKYHLEWEKTWVEDADDWEVVFSDWREHINGATMAGKRCMDLEIIGDSPAPALPQPAPIQTRQPQPSQPANNNRFNPYQQQQQRRSPANNTRGNNNWTSTTINRQQNQGWNRGGGVANKRGPAGFSNHDKKMEALWDLCTQAMRQNPQGMNVLHLRIECMKRGWPEGKPRVKDVNYLLYKNEELGRLYKEQLDPTAKPKWRLC